MVFEIIGFENDVLAIGVMTIPAVLGGTVTHPVFNHGRYAVRIEPLAAVLHAGDITPDQFPCQLRIFAKRSADARPARFAGDISLRREGLGDPHGAVLLANSAGKLSGKAFAPGGTNPDGFRPLAEFTCRIADTGQRLVRVSWIGTDRHRNTQPAALCNFL